VFARNLAFTDEPEKEHCATITGRVTMNVSIMVPVWNEEARLRSCLEHLLNHVLKIERETSEIIICADGCTDNTLALANEYTRRYSQVKVAYWPERLGKGGGLIHGLSLVQGDAVVITDVDLAAPSDEIPKLISLIRSGEADLVLGSRYLPASKIVTRPPVHRRLLSKGFNFLFRTLFHSDIRDTQCGFKAIRTSTFKDLAKNTTVRGFAFDIDLVVKALRKGYSVVEVPIVWGYKEGSKVNSLNQVFAMSHSLLTVWLENRKRLTSKDNLRQN
jgi:glycosyltransferase involved in cell wall biosynthesis